MSKNIVLDNEGSLIFKKRGRPKKADKDSKHNLFKLRMTDEEVDILNNLSVETGKTKSKIMIEALKLYNNASKYID